MIDYREMLKKFFAVAGEDTGQDKVLDVVNGHTEIEFTAEEIEELKAMMKEKWQDWPN